MAACLPMCQLSVGLPFKRCVWSARPPWAAPRVWATVCVRMCVSGRMDVMARRHVFVDVRAAVFSIVLWLCLVYSHTLKGCTAAPQGAVGRGQCSNRVPEGQSRVDFGPNVRFVWSYRVSLP